MFNENIIVYSMVKYVPQIHYLNRTDLPLECCYGTDQCTLLQTQTTVINRNLIIQHSVFQYSDTALSYSVFGRRERFLPVLND